MKSINGKQWKLFLFSGKNALKNQVDKINNLNVFPVPDGDTGSNMIATIANAYEKIAPLKNKNIGDITQKFSREMLMSARGNSGVILSQIFKGISLGLNTKEQASVQDFLLAFKKGYEYAYKSVINPVEGTILTVIRLIYKNVNKNIKNISDIPTFFKYVVKFGKEACAETPLFLPILKETNVTDSGGEGLLLIFQGIYEAIIGNVIKEKQEIKFNNKDSFLDIGYESYDGEFGFCTEIIVNLKDPKKFNKKKLQKYLLTIGDSLVVVHDEEILKVHIHIFDLQVFLKHMIQYGEFVKMKSENIALQINNNFLEESSKNNVQKSNNKIDDDKKISIISCHSGKGLIEYAKELGADYVLEFEPNKKPSVNDFLNIINSINSDKIIILPNESNILLPAQQTIKLIKKKKIMVMPTHFQTQGLVALMHFSDKNTMNKNKEEMNQAIKSLKNGFVTKSLKNAKINGITIKKDKYMAILDKKIVTAQNSSIKAAIELIQKAVDKDMEIITIFYGQDSNKFDAEEIEAFIKDNYDIDVEVINGEQQKYNFLISFE